MKKIWFAVGMVLLMSSPVLAESEVKISGSVELQYINSSDELAAHGDDGFKAEEIYIKIEKEVVDNMSVMIKLDGADMLENESHEHTLGNYSTATEIEGTETDSANGAHDPSVIEEVQIIFKNVANQPLSIYVGKDEMPWVQDYEKFLFGSYVHKWEIDKVFGIHGNYKMDGVGSLDLSFFERDQINKPKHASETSTTDSVAAKLKLDKLVKNLSLSVGYVKHGQDEANETEDATALSVAAKFKVAGFTIHAEMLNLEDTGSKWSKAHVADSEIDIMQVGLDYKFGKALLKARYETMDDDKGAGDDDTLTAFGVSYYFDKKAFITLEHEKEDADGGAVIDQTMLGLAFKY